MHCWGNAVQDALRHGFTIHDHEPSATLCMHCILYKPYCIHTSPASHDQLGLWGGAAAPFGGQAAPLPPYPGLFFLSNFVSTANHSVLDGAPFPCICCICALLLRSLVHLLTRSFMHVGENQEAHRHLGAWRHLSLCHARLIPRQAERPTE